MVRQLMMWLGHLIVRIGVRIYAGEPVREVNLDVLTVAQADAMREHHKRAEEAMRAMFAQARADGWKPPRQWQGGADMELPRFTAHKPPEGTN